MVQRRNTELATSAARSNKLVSSLFPGEIKERILEQQDISTKKQPRGFTRFENEGGMRPLAKVYLETTIMFLDLAGFTSCKFSIFPWSVFH